MLLAGMSTAGRHFAFGPLIAIAIVLGLGLVSRWVMSPTPEQRRRREEARARRDFGLLVPVATVEQRSEAERIAELLTAVGVRATVVLEPPGPTMVSPKGVAREQPGGRHQVLVFPGDEQRARELLA